MRLLYSQDPRSLVIRPTLETNSKRDTVALTFQKILDSNGVNGGGGATLRFQTLETLDLNEYDTLCNIIYGCLGTVQLDNDIFVCVVTDVQKVDEFAGAPIYRITRVAFYSLLHNIYDDVEQMMTTTDTPKANNNFVGSFTDPDTQNPNIMIYPFAALAKILSAGSFFFSPGRDLTRSIQSQSTDNAISKSTTDLFAAADPHFLWNRHMLDSILQIRDQDLTDHEKKILNQQGLLVAAIQGFVGVAPDCFVDPRTRARMAIISRLSCKYAGTRYNARGINDDGHVSNFVETEFAFSIGGNTFSFLQVRGSVPVFWEQTGIQVTPKIDISRGPESTAPAFRKHFQELLSRYSSVHIVNLLAQKDGSAELSLTDAYRTQLRKLDIKGVGYAGFDFHAAVKSGNYDKVSLLLDQIAHVLNEYGYFLKDSTDAVVFRQNGVIRVNCLDCLDRTNVVQCYLAKWALERFLRETYKSSFYLDEAFLATFNGLWADNGDLLSKIYAGTGALKSSLTRKGKQTVLGFLDDAAKSVNRFYINNFQDKGRQEAIDTLLGKNYSGKSLLLKNLANDSVNVELENRIDEYSTKSKIKVMLGTWNVNGKLPNGEPIEPWLASRKIKSPHLIVMGIQELIELTAQQYVTADTDKLRATWEQHLLRSVNTQMDAPYVLLRSLHLVALGLFAFVREDCVEKVRNVETAQCKTGLGGMAGNKGAVAISLLFEDSRVAFVTAHLAAGEKAVDERNRDYRTITEGLKFKERSLADYKTVFWFGDFNYRVSRPTDEVRQLIDAGALEELWDFDQLNQEKNSRQIFEEFDEGPLNFDPTYKYDNGTNIYDSSEKARVPSWTDRVLYRGGDGLRLLEYARAECLMSDHRPVRAVFEMEVIMIDQSRREALKQQLHASTSPTKRDVVMEPLKVRQRTKFVRPASGALLIDFNSMDLPEDTNSAKLDTLQLLEGFGKTTTKAAASSNYDNNATISAPSSKSSYLSSNTKSQFQQQQQQLELSSFNDTSDFELIASVGSGKVKPSSSQEQWWNRKIDEAWIPREGDAANPFYVFS